MSAPLKNRLKADLDEARKARDKFRTLVLSTTYSDLRNLEIELGRESDDDEVITVLVKAVKRRKEAAEQMSKGGREELAEKETLEAALLAEYLPAGLSEDEVREMVRTIKAGGVSEMGPMMGQLMPKLKGVFDGKEAVRIVREELEG